MCDIHTYSHICIFLYIILLPPTSTLFPYTTLFRSSDMDLAAKGLGAKEWNNSLKTKLSLLPKKLFRIRMSRNFLGSSDSLEIGRAVQQECRDRSRMPSSA